MEECNKESGFEDSNNIHIWRKKKRAVQSTVNGIQWHIYPSIPFLCKVTDEQVRYESSVYNSFLRIPQLKREKERERERMKSEEGRVRKRERGESEEGRETKRVRDNEEMRKEGWEREWANGDMKRRKNDERWRRKLSSVTKHTKLRITWESTWAL
jgi:hypothetical protein